MAFDNFWYAQPSYMECAPPLSMAIFKNNQKKLMNMAALTKTKEGARLLFMYKEVIWYSACLKQQKI